MYIPHPTSLDGYGATSNNYGMDRKRICRCVRQNFHESHGYNYLNLSSCHHHNSQLRVCLLVHRLNPKRWTGILYCPLIKIPDGSHFRRSGSRSLAICRKRRFELLRRLLPHHLEARFVKISIGFIMQIFESLRISIPTGCHTFWRWFRILQLMTVLLRHGHVIESYHSLPSVLLVLLMDAKAYQVKRRSLKPCF
jgi:hypothetical protein